MRRKLRETKDRGLEARLAIALERAELAEGRLSSTAQQLDASQLEVLRLRERLAVDSAPRVAMSVNVNDGGSVTFNGTAHSGR